MTQKKRIMRRFKMNEISAVDNPAQEPAVMTLIKRRLPAPKRMTKADDNPKRSVWYGYWDLIGKSIVKNQSIVTGQQQEAISTEIALGATSVDDAIARARVKHPEAFGEQAETSLDLYHDKNEIGNAPPNPEDVVEEVERNANMSKFNSRQYVDSIGSKEVAKYQEAHGGSKVEALRNMRKGVEALAKGGNDGGGVLAKSYNDARASGMSRVEALRKARIENPAAFTEYQRG